MTKLPGLLLISLLLTATVFAQPPLPGSPVGSIVPAAPVPAGIAPAPLPTNQLQTPAAIPAEVLEAAKAKQAAEYGECKKSHEYWCKEVTRLSAKASANNSHLVARAQGKVAELSTKAKELVSPKYLDQLVKQQLATKAESDGLQNAYKASVQKELDIKEAERQRLAALAEAERQRIAAAEERARKEAAIQAEAERIAEIAREAERKADAIREKEMATALAERLRRQEAEDKKTWGIITSDKYNRLEIGMDKNDVEKVLGPGTMLSSNTNPAFGTITDYQWNCKNLSARVDITFRGSKLYDKTLTPLTKGEYQLMGSGEGD